MKNFYAKTVLSMLIIPAISGMSLAEDNDKVRYRILPVTCDSCNDAVIDLQPESNGKALTVLWSTGSTTEDLAMIGPGIYHVRIIDSKGNFTDEEIIIEPYSELVAEMTVNHPTCHGYSDGSISITTTSEQGNISIYLNGEELDETGLIEGLPAGNYEVLLSDRHNRTLSRTFTLTDPDPVSVKHHTGYLHCLTNSAMIDVEANGGTGSYHMVWEDGYSGSFRTDLEPGVYKLNVIDGNHCVASEVIDIPDHSGNLHVRISAVSATSSESNDGAIDLDVEGGDGVIMFNWSTGYTGEDLYFASAGDYSVTVTDGNGCKINLDITIPYADLMN